MSQNSQALKVGDSVKVNSHVTDPDLGTDISGWVGRVVEIEGDFISIEWDSLVLSSMPSAIISQCEIVGLDWSAMHLGMSEVERTQPRDSVADFEEVLEHLEYIHQWDYLEEAADGIKTALEDIDLDDEGAVFEAWGEYLEDKVKFPFDAVVYESQERGALREGDKVKVLEIVSIEGMYGVLVSVSCRRSVYQIPLCDLEVSGKASSNYRPVKDYAIWFANH